MNKKVIVRTALVAVLVGALGYSFVAKSETKLIPFQGKLTDASGQVISDGAIVVQFKMYDAPVGGQAKWNGEVQMLSVNGGLVNTTLGTKASLKNVDFSSPTYLEITIDANGDNQIGPEDPPLLPRQSIIPAVYAVQAGDARTLSGYDWSSIFGTNDPTGKIPGDKLANKSIDTDQLKDGAVTATKIKAGAVTTDKIANKAIKSNQIADGAVTSIQLADGAVNTAQVADGAIKTDKIATNSITMKLMEERKMVDAYETVAPIGSIACSKGVEDFSVSSISPAYQEIPGLSVKLKTSGRPVMIMLQGMTPGSGSYLKTFGGGWIHLQRNDSTVNYGFTLYTTGLNGDWVSLTPSSTITFIDVPTEGEQRYSIWSTRDLSNHYLEYHNVKLVAFEL